MHRPRMRVTVKCDLCKCGKVHCLRTTLIYQNCFLEQSKRRLNTGNACHWSVPNLLYVPLLSKIIETEVYKTIIFPMVLYGCESWSLVLMEESRLRVFENRVLRRIFGPQREAVT